MGVQMTTFLSLETTTMAQPLGSNSLGIPPTPSRSLFLSLPLEIRLQIYGYVIDFSPARHTHLSPIQVYPPYNSSACFLLAITERHKASQGVLDERTNPKPLSSLSSVIKASQPLLASKGTGCGCIPSALLRTCKQVYEEACMLPWERNEFVFVNWFCSGVYAARAFIKALKPWQRVNMRWARVEVLRRDLEDTWVASMVGGRQGTGEWRDLCRLWSGDMQTQCGGLWGLKLGIKGRIGGSVIGEAIDGTGGVTVTVDEPVPQQAAVDQRRNTKNGLLDIESPWITEGLAQISSLKWLEIEIEDDDISRDAKIELCIKLKERLSNIRKKEIEVLLVEQVVEEVKANKTVGARSGDPDDDYIWGLDS